MASSLLSSLSLLKTSTIKVSAVSTTTTTPIISAPAETLTLDQKFGRKGVKFSEPGDIPTVELTSRNGSSVKLNISNAHVTSYKPKVYWKDDGYEEVLYTLPGSKGGIGLVVNEVPDPNPKVQLRGKPPAAATATASEWTVKDVDSDSIDALQVELSCTKGTLDISYVVSLYDSSMATAVVLKNNGRKPVSLTSAILSHLMFKSRGGTGVQGLRGCSYCTSPPLSSPFEILSPFEATKTEEPGFLFSFGWQPEKKPGEWAVQEVPITVLRHKLSRVYAAPPEERSKEFHRSNPSKFETIDQGRRLCFRMIRMGFEDIYLSSPGSYSKKYGKDYFICTGPASMLVPVTINPGEEWKGAQVIEHDNL